MRQDLVQEHWREKKLYSVLRQPLLDGEFKDAFALADFIEESGGSQAEANLVRKMRKLDLVPTLAGGITRQAMQDALATPFGQMAGFISQMSPLSVNDAIFAALNNEPMPGSIVPPTREDFHNEQWSEWLIRIGGVPTPPFVCDWAAMVGYDANNGAIIRPSHKRVWSWENFRKTQLLAVLIPDRDWPEVKKLWNTNPLRAVDAINSFTRMKMRERSLAQRIFGPEPITAEEIGAANPPPKFVEMSPVHRPADRVAFPGTDAPFPP